VKLREAFEGNLNRRLKMSPTLLAIELARRSFPGDDVDL
jgi:hypothetical protein